MTKKSKRIILVTMITFSTLILTLFILPYQFPGYFLYNQEPNITTIFVLTDFDINQPTFTAIPRVNNDYNEKNSEVGIEVTKFQRINGIFWEINQDNVLTYGKVEDYSINEIINVARKINLSRVNPDEEKIILNNEIEIPEYTPISVEDEYYGTISNSDYRDFEISDFKSIKFGMTASEVYTKLDYTRVVSPGKITKLYERHTSINKDGVNFVILAFDKDADDFPNAKLIQAKIVYMDRRIENLPLQ